MRALALRGRLLVLLLLVSAAAPASAQLPPLVVPGSRLRVDLFGRFEDWSKRFRHGDKEEAAADFIRASADASWLPLLTDTEATLGRITGTPATGLSLGSSRATLLASAGTGGVGVAYGLTSRLTLFGSVPFVRVRVQQTLGIDSASSTLGLNPAHPLFGTDAGRTLAIRFLNELSTTLTTLGNQIQSGVYDADPALKALAQTTLARGTVMRADLDLLFGESSSGTPFLPVSGSAAAAALTATLDQLRTTLTTTLAVPGFAAAAPLPSQRVSAGEFLSVLNAGGGPFALRPLPGATITQLGDAEVGAVFQWLDRAPPRGLRIRSALRGTVRLPTGYLARSDELVALSAGERQLDLQGDLVADLELGRLGTRLTARYVYQRSGRLERRANDPDQPIAVRTLLSDLTRDPGEIIEGMVEPFVRIGPTFALVGGARAWSKGEDRWSYAPGAAPIPGVDPAILGRDSKERALALSAGVSFVHPGLRRDGSAGLPMDAALRYEWVAAGSEGRVAARRGVSILLRLYR